MLALKLIHVWKGDPWRLSFQKQNSSPAVIALRLKQLKCIFDILFKEIVAYWFKFHLFFFVTCPVDSKSVFPDSKVHGANMGPIWGRQDSGGPHVGPMIFAISIVLYTS